MVVAGVGCGSSVLDTDAGGGVALVTGKETTSVGRFIEAHTLEATRSAHNPNNVAVRFPKRGALFSLRGLGGSGGSNGLSFTWVFCGLSIIVLSPFYFEKSGAR